MQSGSPKKISCLAVCPSSVLPHISRLISLAHRHHALLTTTTTSKKKNHHQQPQHKSPNMEGLLGLTLELTPEVAQELRRRRRPRAEEEEKPQKLSSSSSSVAEDEPDQADEVNHGLDNDDNASTSSPQSSEDESTVLSLGPPPSRPLVLVCTERLIGYQPSTPQEQKLVTEQVRTALWGTGSNEDETPADEKQLSDMFEGQIAFHTDSEQAQLQGLYDKTEWTIIEYPPYLYWSEPGSSVDPHIVVLSTARLWKSLYVTTGLPPVDALLCHVRDCGRPLWWKSRMAKALRSLGRTEAAAKKERQQARALKHWQTRRSTDLEKLYTVRETLAHKVKMEQQRLKELLQQRDATVAEKLRVAQMGLERLDFTAANSFVLPEDPLVLCHDYDYGSEEPLGEMGGNTADDMWDVLNGNDVDDDDGDGVGDEIEHDEDRLQQETDWSSDKDGENKSNALHPEQSRSNDLKNAEASYRQKLDVANAEEEAMREACTTNEMRTAMAIVKALEDRLSKTDELLESIQEEEWAAQEDEENDDNGVVHPNVNNKVVEGQSPQALSLLDQVLAMVLSAMPTPVDGSESEHLTWKKYLHESTILDWKSYFGRVPPGASLEGSDAWEPTSYLEPEKQSTSQKVASDELKKSLGIVDNASDDWEQWDEWTDDDDDDEGAPKSRAVASPPSQPVVGLRPGGKVL